MRFETKIAVLLRDDLLTWQRLNVTAFLVSGITAAHPQLVGEPYEDADGTPYLAMLGQPVLVLEGSKEVAHRRPPAGARAGPAARGLHRRPVRHRVRRGQPGRRTGGAADSLDLVGLAVHGPKNAVDKVLKGARMHQ